MVGSTLVAAWGATYIAGGSRTAAPHLFYLPVVLAALWARPALATLWAVGVGVVAGPLMPLHTTDGTAQSLVNWLGRLGAFVAVALLVSLFQQHHRRLAARDQEVARRERDLEAHRAAILQIIAHEIRTPVTVLGGSVELLASGRADNHGAKLHAAMRRSMRRLEDLTTLVTATTEQHPQDSPPEELTVGELLRPVLTEIAGHHDATRIVIDHTHDTCRLSAPVHVRLAVRLLLENALRFSEADVELYCGIEGDQLCIRIADRGPGLPESALRNVQPFQQGDPSTTRQHGGTGLGLYTADRLVARLDGTLEVTARQPRGTQIVIRLPVVGLRRG